MAAKTLHNDQCNLLQSVAAPASTIARSFQGQTNIESGQSSTLQQSGSTSLAANCGPSEMTPFAVLLSKVCIWGRDFSPHSPYGVHMGYGAGLNPASSFFAAHSIKI